MDAADGDMRHLVQALPPGDYVNAPEAIERVVIHIWPDGRVLLEGDRARIEELLRRCAEARLTVRVDHAGMCG